MLLTYQLTYVLTLTYLMTHLLTYLLPHLITLSITYFMIYYITNIDVQGEAFRGVKSGKFQNWPPSAGKFS